MAQSRTAATIVIPAHNEQAGLARLLPLLLDPHDANALRIIVVCNGCTDQSASVAGSFGPSVEVVELEEASKAAALSTGAAMTRQFPILFVDADVAIDSASVAAIVRTLESGDVLAAAPQRILDREGVTRPANWYYDVWERLPQVRAGLFGRGVIALSESGHARVAELPRFISDDLAFSEAFQPGERRVVDDASVTVWPARTWKALVKRRVRVIQGNRQLAQAERVSGSSTTSINDLLRIVRHEPLLAGPVFVFLWTTVAARISERRMRSRENVWLRDETSRAR
jgi:glycosyltransferase involved in cell wall biosynthesis